MIERATTQWLLKMAWRSPVSWLIVALVALAWPVLVTLQSVGVTTFANPSYAALYEIGFVAAQIGAILAISTLSKGSWWLSRTAPIQRFRAEFVGITICALALILAAWAFPLSISNGSNDVPIGHMLATAMVASLRLAAIGVCVLALPLSNLTKVALMPLVTWIIPGLLPMGSEPWSTLRQCFELGRDFRFPWVEESPASVWQESILPILGLCLLRFAEATRKAFRPCATPSSEISTPT